MTDEGLETFEGILHLYSETGTEGGYWALQDREYITHITPGYGVFSGNHVWDQANPQRHGKTAEAAEVLKDGEWLPLPDPMQEEPDYIESSLFKGETRGDREADKRLMAKYDFKIIYSEDHWDEMWGKGNWHYEDEEAHTAIAPDGQRWLSRGTPNTEPQRPYGVAQGELTRNTVLWDDGVEEERPSDSLLIERWSYEGLKVLANGDHLTIYDKIYHAPVWSGEIKLKQHKLFTESASGLWIHADQEGITRESWAQFFFDQLPATLVRAVTA